MFKCKECKVFVLFLLFVSIFADQTAKNVAPSSNLVNSNIDLYDVFVERLEKELKKDLSLFRLELRDKGKSEITLNFLSVDYLYLVITNSDVKPSIILAQSALESYWGKRSIGNNYFGIKGTGHKRKTVEYIDGKRIVTYQNFRRFESIEEGISFHSDLLTDKYSILSDMSVKTVLPKLKRYATDPMYTNKISKVITDYNLEHIDSLKLSNQFLLDLLNR